jgi:type II secretion system protein G
MGLDLLRSHLAQDARRKRTSADLDSLSQLIEDYRQAVGDYPDNERGLQSLIGRARKSGVRLQGERTLLNRLPRDAWGTHYGYHRLPSRSVRAFEVFSAGPDAAFGTEDDLSSLETGR